MDANHTEESKMTREYETRNESDLRDPAGNVFALGQMVADDEPATAANYGTVIGFVATDLDQYPSIVVRWEQPEWGTEILAGHQAHMDAAPVVDDAFVVPAARASRR